jgi:hypothetical protein
MKGYLEGEPPVCEGCGKAVLRGQFIHHYDDAGAVHVNCDDPNASTDPLAVDEGAGPVYVLLGSPLMLYKAWQSGVSKTKLFIHPDDLPLTFPELDDVALGRFARSYLAECERAFHKVAGEKEMPFSLIASMHGALALYRIALEANAETYTLTSEGVTVAGEPQGDWKVTVKRLKRPASVGRNAKRQDRETGLGPKGEHAVGEAETPVTSSVSTEPGVE